MLNLCGITEKGVRSLMQTQVCSADLLLVDDRLMNDWQLLYEILEAVQPQEILHISGGFSEAADVFAGIPVRQVAAQAERYSFWR